MIITGNTTGAGISGLINPDSNHTHDPAKHHDANPGVKTEVTYTASSDKSIRLAQLRDEVQSGKYTFDMDKLSDAIMDKSKEL